MIPGGFTQVDGELAVDKLLHMKHRPDAIFAVNDPVAIGAFSKIKQMKISIPDEIALIGFSNNPVSSLIEPSMTTVEQPSHEIGKVAAQLLLEKINHESKNDVIIQKILKTKLIVRESSKKNKL